MFALLSSFGIAFSQTPIPLWKGDIPFNKKDISVEELNENNRIAKVSIPVLYHYATKTSASSSKTAIIIVPGGGYIREAIDHEGWLAAEWFNNHGIEAFVLKYRLPDTELTTNSHMVPLMDAQEAIALVRSRAVEFGINPHKIGIIGFSAGGHLAASASTLFASPVNTMQSTEAIHPDFSILMYPVITMDDHYTHKGSKENLIGTNPSQQLVHLFSLENQVSDKTPITLIVHSLDDNAVPIHNSDLYAENLRNKGGDVTKITLPTGGHGFGFRSNTPVSSWTKYLEVWLNTRILAQ